MLSVSASRFRSGLLATGLAFFASAATGSAAVLFSDAFAYSDGTALKDTGNWTLFAGTGATTPSVQSGELIVQSSPSSFDRLAADLVSTYSTNSLFVGFDITVTDAPAANINLVYFGTTPGGGTNTTSGGYFNVIAVDANNVKFGVSVNPNNTGVQTADSYAINTTLRAVMEYKFVDGALNNEARLYINGSLVATSLYGASPVEVAGFRYVGLKQPVSANSAGFLIDDFLVATTFADAATFAAVPEPSAYAAILGGAVLMGIACQRRRRVLAGRRT